MSRLPSTVNSRSSRRMPANSTLMTSVPSVTYTSVLGIQWVSPANSRRPASCLRRYSDELTLHMADCFRRVPHDHRLCKLSYPGLTNTCGRSPFRARKRMEDLDPDEVAAEQPQ